MALIKHSNSLDLTRQAIVLDLGDLHRQGEALKAAAMRRASEILAQAQRERQQLIESAHALGHSEGLAAGRLEGERQGAAAGLEKALAQRAQELQRLDAGFSAGLDAMVQRREAMLADARQDLLRLAALMAQKITKRTIQLHPEVVVAQLESVLALVLRPSRLVVRVHPEDLEIVRAALPGMGQRFACVQHVELIEDKALERGSCAARVAEPGGGEIDASIDTQLDRIVEALLPGTTPGTAPGETP